MKRLSRMISALLMATLMFTLLSFAVPSTALAASTDDFFSDSVFLGDSITVGLDTYVASLRQKNSSAFSDAYFHAKVNYSLHGSLGGDYESQHPYYQGVQLQPQKVIASIAPAKLFIMLGTNDVQDDLSDAIANYKTLISRIQSASPGTAIYIISVPPMVSSSETKTMTNARIDSMNAKIQSMCSSLGLTYINIADALKDSGGGLVPSYSGDGYVHFNNTGYAAMVDALRAFAKAQTKTVSVINVTTCLNLRAKADPTASVIKKIPAGAKLTLEEAFVNGEWHKVTYNGSTGYIHCDYAHLDFATYTDATIIKVNESVNARFGPATSHKVKMTIPKGASVKVIREYEQSDWYLVYYNGQHAYVRNDFVAF